MEADLVTSQAQYVTVGAILFVDNATPTSSGYVKVESIDVSGFTVSWIDTNTNSSVGWQLGITDIILTGPQGPIGPAGPVGGTNTQVLYNSGGTVAGSNNLTFDGSTVTGYNVTVSNEFNLSGQIFHSHGADGFSVNENFNAGNVATTAYHWTSGDAGRDIMFSIAKTGQFTNMFGTYGTAGANTMVLASEAANATNFDFRSGVGIAGSLDLSGGSLLFRAGATGQIFAPLLENHIGPSVVYCDSANNGLLTYGGNNWYNYPALGPVDICGALIKNVGSIEGYGPVSLTSNSSDVTISTGATTGGFFQVFAYGGDAIITSPSNNVGLYAGGGNIIATGSIIPETTAEHPTSSLGTSAQRWSDAYIGTGSLHFGTGPDDIASITSITEPGITGLSITGDLIPSANLTYSLGTSANRWADAYIGPASLHFGAGTEDYAVIGAVGGPGGTGLRITGDLIPSATETYNLGTTTQRWNSIFVGPATINIAGPIGSGKVGTIGTDSDGIVFTESGFATPFLTVGPEILVGATLAGAIGGWQLSASGSATGTNYDLVAQQNGVVIGSGLTGPIYSLIQSQKTNISSITAGAGISVIGSGTTSVTVSLAATGPGPITVSYPSSVSLNAYGQVTAIASGATGGAVTRPNTGNTLFVDHVYGDDTTALTSINSYPFKTIQAAINAASSGNQILVADGTYAETLTMKQNVYVRGASVPAVVIQPTVAATPGLTLTAVTMATNSRLEDVTISMAATAANQVLKAISFNGAAAPGSKFRTGVVSITDTGFAGCSLYGAYADGTGATGLSSNNTFQRTSMTITGNASSALVRGIVCNGENRVSFRDCNIYAVQTGGTAGATACIALETTAAGAIIECRTSSISGTGNDISQTNSNSTILLGLTDLVNSTANSLGFTETTQTSDQNFTIAIAGDENPPQTTFYVAPGTLFYTKQNPVYSVPINIPFNQPTLINSISVSPNTTIGSGITFTVNRNMVAGNPIGITSMSVYLPGSTTTGVFSINKSMRIGTGETYNVSFVGNFSNGNIATANISLV